MNNNLRRKRSDSREKRLGSPDGAAVATAGENSPSESCIAAANSSSSSSSGDDSPHTCSGKPPAKIAKQSQDSRPDERKISTTKSKQEKQKPKRLTAYNVFFREQRAILEASGVSIWEIFDREVKQESTNAKPKNEFQALVKIMSNRWKELPPLEQAAYETKAAEIWSKECEDAVQSSLTESAGDSSSARDSSSSTTSQEEGTAVVSDDTPGKRAGIIPLTVGPEGLTKQKASKNSATWSALSSNSPRGNNNASSSAPQVSFQLKGAPQASQEAVEKAGSIEDVDPCSVESQLDQIKDVVSATKQSGDSIRYGILGHLISSFSDTLLEIMNASPESLTQLLLVMNSANHGHDRTTAARSNQQSTTAQDASSELTKLIQEQIQQNPSTENMQEGPGSDQESAMKLILEAMQQKANNNSFAQGRPQELDQDSEKKLTQSLPAQHPPANIDHNTLSAQEAAATILMSQAQSSDEMKQYMNILKLLQSSSSTNNQEQQSFQSSGLLSRPMAFSAVSDNYLPIPREPSLAQDSLSRSMNSSQVQGQQPQNNQAMQQLLSILQQNGRQNN